jgi:hypothetical protein
MYIFPYASRHNYPNGLVRYNEGFAAYHQRIDACHKLVIAVGLSAGLERVCGRAAPDAPERVSDQRRCTGS